MAQKHLKELLKEDQEPFQLKDYIATKKCQLLKKQQQQQQLVVPPKSKLQLKKPKNISSKNTSIFCKNACFFSLQESPDLRKSPKLFDFPPSPVPNKSPNRVFLNVPAKTAALLLEAAIRIQTHKSKPKTQIKNSGFGLFGSMLKRLNLKNRTQKINSKTEDQNRGYSVLENVEEEKIASVSSSTSTSSSSYSSSCSCNERLSSLDLESSSSSGRSLHEDEDDEEFEFTNVLKESNENDDKNNNNNKNGEYYSGICLSPLSPFRFTLHRSSSPGRCSPAKSPVRCKFEGNVKYEQESLVKFQDEDEEDKEQNSPVSVLDPPFEDDYDGHEEDSYDDIECSYAFVHRAQQDLLNRLHRFQKLAELDPIELEKRLIEDEEEYALEYAREFEPTQPHDFMQEVDVKKPGIKRLISDLIIEEECEEDSCEEQVIKRVCNRLESWKEVESNTIDMMVEMDLRREIANWKKSQKEIGETAVDIEVAIFVALVDELVDDLV